MFEKIAIRTAKTFYVLAIGLGVVALAWVCLANMPLWAAALVFCLALPLVALAAAPIAACGAMLAGIVAGLATLIVGATARLARRAG